MTNLENKEKVVLDLEELRKCLHSQSDTIFDTTIKLDRASIILDHWVQEYSYNEKPTPMAAMACWNGADESTHAKQSAKWFHDYDYIFQFIEIVQDYVFEANKMLENALKKGVN